jgi:GTP cyclohydrolase IB
VQSDKETRGITLCNVGVTSVEIPLLIVERGGGVQTVQAVACLSTSLQAERKGAHMSRFMIQLSELTKKKVTPALLRSFLESTLSYNEADAAELTAEFKYFIEKQSPVTKHSAPMGYKCCFKGAIKRGGLVEKSYLTIGVVVPISVLCPCSKAIAAYGAHNQRAEIDANVILSRSTDNGVLWIEDIITALEQCASSQLYPILKRADEKLVTEEQYEKPRFVEDVVREASLALRTLPQVIGFTVKARAIESIHNHAAWAANRENFDSVTGF